MVRIEHLLCATWEEGTLDNVWSSCEETAWLTSLEVNESDYKIRFFPYHTAWFYLLTNLDWLALESQIPILYRHLLNTITWIHGYPLKLILFYACFPSPPLCSPHACLLPVCFLSSSFNPCFNRSNLFLRLQSITQIYSWRGEADHKAPFYWVPNADWLKSKELAAGTQLTNV